MSDAAHYSAFAQFVHHHWLMLMFLAWLWRRPVSVRVDESIIAKWKHR